MDDRLAVTLRVAERWLALPLETVLRVERAVALEMPVAAQGAFLGWANDGGIPLPVVSLHLSLGLPFPGIRPQHRLVLCTEDSATVGLLVDEVGEIVTVPNQAQLQQHADWLSVEGLLGTLEKRDGLILLYGLRTFLRGLKFMECQPQEAADVH